MTFGKQRTRLIALACVSLSLAGCQTTPGGGTDVACVSFNAITWSRKDTVETARQVRVHNATGSALCGWGKK